MTGGLLNLASVGQQNIIINGELTQRTISFWKKAYKKYTNFGLQKFRVDYEGTPTLKLTEQSVFQFKIPRYADLLVDTFLSVTLPTIWSPIFPPQEIDGSTSFTPWAPYEFKWIDFLGAQMISKITITCGNQKLQEFSGTYLMSLVLRDFPEEKRKLFYEMIGHVPELNDPANSGTRVNAYPNAFYTDNPAGAEPSIRARELLIPLNSWFSLTTEMAFPLVSLQYNILEIDVTFRPLNELFRIRDVLDYTNFFPYVAPNFNQYTMQFYRFLQTPPDITLGYNSYLNQNTSWNADIHLRCTYCFLSNEERVFFAKKDQSYLFRQVYEQIFYNVTGPNKVDLNSIGLVSNWTFYFQRSDVNLRNEWTNYTNWPYNYLPSDVMFAPSSGAFFVSTTGATIGPGSNVDTTLTGLYITGTYTSQNTRDILIGLGILLDGEYRENLQPAGVYNYIEKYTRTGGRAPDGLYCYNFTLNTSPFDLQPSGALNMNLFHLIQWEFTTITPLLDPFAQVLTICNPETGEIVGINKPTWRIFEYNFNLYVMEERINRLIIVGGNAGLEYAT